MAYQLAIFDFDGTLADSFPFFIGVFNQLASKHGYKAVSPHEIEGLRNSSTAEILAHLGLPRWKIPFVARDFMHLMRESGTSVKMFPGMEEALVHLKEQGVTLALVSANAPDNVQRVLGPAVMALFSHVDCGVSMFGKANKIKKAVKRLGMAGAQTIYVGDQLSDAEAAREAGVAFGAVAWGYAAIESLRRYELAQEFGSVQSLSRLV
jgi:phosphoglycolate phosphatase